MVRLGVWLTLLGGLARCGPLAAQDAATQFWPQIDTYVRLTKLTRIYVSLSGTEAGDQSGGDGTTGVYFDYVAFPNPRGTLLPTKDMSLVRHMLLRAGYAYNAAGGGDPATGTAQIELTGRVPLAGRGVLSVRNRLDVNITDGKTDPRYRIREQLEHTVRIRKAALDPYAFIEFVYDFNDDAWIQTRVRTGVEFHHWSWIVPEVYYEWNHDTGESGGDTRGLGLVVSLYLR